MCDKSLILKLFLRALFCDRRDFSIFFWLGYNPRLMYYVNCDRFLSYEIYFALDYRLLMMMSTSKGKTEEGLQSLKTKRKLRQWLRWLMRDQNTFNNWRLIARVIAGRPLARRKTVRKASKNKERQNCNLM